MTQSEQDIAGRKVTGAESNGGRCHWVEPGSGASITVEGSVIRHVKDQVLEGYHALPKRGAEVGGLLLGHVVAKEPLKVEIDDFEPVPCEYRFGPSFVLSEADRVKLEEILVRRRSDSQLSVVGHYRSCTGRELAVDAADEELLKAYFHEPEHVFLSIKPVASRRCVARFFTRREGHLPAGAAEPPVPFGDGQAGLDSKRAPVEQHVALTEPPGGIPKEIAVQRHADLRRNWGAPWEAVARHERLWPWMAVLATIVIAFTFVFQTWGSARQARWPHLGLDVKQTTGGIRVSWDESAPALQNVTRGLLSISNGHVENQIQLAASDIARGSFSYNSPANDVLVRLSVYGSGARATTESFRMVAVAPPAPPPEPAPAQQVKPAVEAPAPESPEQTPAENTEKPQPVRADSPARGAVQAVAIHEVRPGIPHGIRARIRKPIVVPVKVQISASGKVTSAVPHKGSNPLYSYLAVRAAASAKWWKFKPARAKSGRPIPTSKTLYFVFKS